MTALAAEPTASDLDLFDGSREGTYRWRDETVRYLRSRGLKADRPLLPLSGATYDNGEVTGLTDWTLIARRQKALKMAESLDAASDLAAKAGSRFHAVLLFRRLRSTPDAYVCMTLANFAELLSAVTSEDGATP